MNRGDPDLVAIAQTPVRVSRAALGTWTMSGRMWGGTDQRESIATIQAALDQGANLIPNFHFLERAMDNRFETPITATEIDSANARTPEPASAKANGQPPQLQASLLELNGVLLIVMGGLTAIFTAAAFLISAH